MLFSLLQHLGDELRFVVVSLARQSRLSLSRWAAVARTTSSLYLFDQAFEPVLWPSVLAEIARVHQVESLLHVGTDSWFSTQLGSLRSFLPGVKIVDQPVVSSQGQLEVPETSAARDLVLALGESTAVAAERLAPEGKLLRLPLGLDCSTLPDAGLSSARRQAIREDLGIEEGATLVTMSADLVPEKRPEDFVAVARHLRDDDSLFFLLCGEGPLSGTVQDLARCFSLSRFSLASPQLSPGG